MIYYKNTSRVDIRIGDKVFKRGEITGTDRYIVHKGLTRVGIVTVKTPKDAKNEKPKRRLTNVRAHRVKTKKFDPEAIDKPIETEPEVEVVEPNEVGNVVETPKDTESETTETSEDSAE